MASNISGFTRAGELDRRIQLLGLTYTKIKGEEVETFAEILTMPAQRTDQGGNEQIKAGSVTHLSQVQWLIRYNSQIISQTPNYEAMKLAEVIDSPVYLQNNAGQILYDIFGNPLVSVDNTTTVLYDIIDVQEIGRKVEMLLICERWR